MNKLGNLEPKNVFRYFEEICAIPHGSGNVEAISNYCMQFAKEHKLQARQDEVLDVVIVKEATAGYENAPTVMLQGHLDMVCEKVPESNFDFLNDSLELMIEEDYITANGTTLGGDNGIAVAMMLAILADNTLEHPRLECVFTVDEETGLVGAYALDTSDLQSKYMINLDSEEEGIFTVSCAGGIGVESCLPIEWQETEGVRYQIAVDGLLGGHSGAEIHKEHGNSNILMGRLLNALDNEVNFLIADIKGGSAGNAIPRRTDAFVYVKEEDCERFEEILSEYDAIYKNEYRASDPDVKVWFVNEGMQTGKTFTPRSQALFLYLIHIVPNGVQKMSMEIKDLVQTSCNLGVLSTKKDCVSLAISIRSSLESEKLALADRVIHSVEFLGGTADARGSYPGWEFKKESALRDIMVEVYRKKFGKEAKVAAIHAGLECGIFSGKMPELDCVSIGPDMSEIHSPQERLSISSTKRTYEFVLEVLKAIK